MLYLASQSPRRRQLLEQLGVEFTVLDVAVPEQRLPTETPHAYVSRVAEAKAHAGLALLTAGKDAVVLGAATEVLLSETGELPDGEVLEHYSIIDSRFAARVVDRVAGQGGGLVVEVSGRAFPVGEGKFTLDAADELGLGFLLR